MSGGDFQTDLEIMIRCRAPSPQAGTVHVGYRSDQITDFRGTTLRIGRATLSQYRSDHEWQTDVYYAMALVNWAFERCVLLDGAWSLDNMRRHLLGKQRKDSGIYEWDGWTGSASSDAPGSLVRWAVDLRRAEKK